MSISHFKKIPNHHSQVADANPLQRLLYWIVERHKIHLRKQAGAPKPWTEDPILQDYFFTNPYRENDKTTVWFRENIREPLRNEPNVLFATIVFRWFNYIPTGQLLINHDLIHTWNTDCALEVFKDKPKIFTGAFMVKSPNGVYPKTRGIGNCIDVVQKDIPNLIDRITKTPTLESTFRDLLRYPYLGDFMAYEVVTDLRHTHFLQKASDVNTWCSLGPGGIRGFRRLFNLTPITHSPPDKLDAMLIDLRQILPIINEWLVHVYRMPQFEMRELEHSLCEFDKYERARLNEGKLKRNYPGR